MADWVLAIIIFAVACILAVIAGSAIGKWTNL